MRIISGTFRGRIIKSPPDRFTRPTTDKVKESLFNYLANFMDFEGSKVCDIYAGSGSLGLEALSRGSGEIHFIEKNYQVFKVLSKNIESLRAEDSTRIFKMPAIRFASLSQHEKYDLILADPPFFKNDVYDVIKKLLSKNYLADSGLIIVERSIQTKKEDIENFKIEPFKQIGDSLIYQFSNNFISN